MIKIMVSIKAFSDGILARFKRKRESKNGDISKENLIRMEDLKKEMKEIERLEPVYFPWEDIENCMKKDEWRKTDIKCPQCWKLLYIIYFESPAWTRKHLCWRAWDMLVCPRCKKWYSFHCHIMN